MFRRNFLTGLLITLPIAAALWIFVGLARFVDGLFPDVWRPRFFFNQPLPGLGLVVATAIVFVTGLLARNFLGQRILMWMDGALAHVPVFGKTYGLLKQITQSVFGKQAHAFRRVVLVKYPHERMWSIGFVTAFDPEIEYRLNRKILAVYVPTTPNPTSGYYVFVPEEDAIPLELPVDQALKLVVTLGIVKTESGLIKLAELADKR